MKGYLSILEVEKANELKTLSKVFIFYFEFSLRRTIKRDASLGGLRKIECSSIKIKSKERHKITSWTPRYSLWTFGSRKSRQSEVPTLVRSPGALELSCQARLSIESPDASRKSRQSKVLTPARSPGALGLSRLARLSVGSPDGSRKSQQSSGVPTIVEQAKWPTCLNSSFQ